MSSYREWTRPELEAPYTAEVAKKPRSLAREIVETAILTVVIFLAVRAMVLNYKVEGLSMAPTLQHGQHLLVNRAIYFNLDADLVHRVWPGATTVNDRVYFFTPPQRGDIVVLWPPNSSDRPYIKRVIALPGETVAIRDGIVTVNGVPLDENYTRAPAAYTMTPRKVAPGEYFVLGDNRNNSSDSHGFGPVPLDHVIGKAFFSYWPFDSAGGIPHERYAAAADR